MQGAVGGRRSKRGLVIALVVLGGLGLGGWRYAVGPRLTVVAATQQPLVQRVVASGRVQAPAKIQLGTQIGGVARQVHVEPGQGVVAGARLLELESAELEAALRSAQASVVQARARLEGIRRVSSSMAREELRQAEVAERLAAAQSRKLADLASRQIVSGQEQENAQAALEQAESRRLAAETRLQSLAAGGTELLLAQAALSQALAAQQVAEARLAASRIVAPADGVVLERRVEPGDVIAPGTPLLILARRGERYLQVHPEESSLAYLQPGQRGIASADAYPAVHFPVELTEIAPAVDPLRGTIEVRLRILEPPAFLLPEMTVSVDIEVARRDSALTLPAELVRDRESAPWVLVLQDGRTARRAVTLGLRGEGMLEIADGLAPGELVVHPANRIGAGKRARAAIPGP